VTTGRKIHVFLHSKAFNAQRAKRTALHIATPATFFRTLSSVLKVETKNRRVTVDTVLWLALPGSRFSSASVSSLQYHCCMDFLRGVTLQRMFLRMTT
jgi:hypothetical protein